MAEVEKKLDEFIPEELVHILPTYYKRFFPCETFIKWLSYGNDDELEKREFSFTLDGDVYLRFLSFRNAQEFQEELKKKKPVKIDIGAIYANSLKDKRNTQRTPLEKEFVLDIDLTDYDDVRTCCKEAKVCQKCWSFLSVAVEVLDAALRNDYGYKHILWVFSGRRGIHCWVSDYDARTLSAWERGCVAQYLSLSQPDSKSSKRVNIATDKIDPFTRRALSVVERVFDNIMLEEQDILSTQEGINYLLNLIPNETLRDLCEKALNKIHADSEVMNIEVTSKKKWDIFVNEVENFNSESSKKSRKKRSSTEYLIEEIKLHYLYPRLDINVTTGLNHLLKAPFCIHPKTGFVCVPFNPKEVDTFDPLAVPKINELLHEISSEEMDIEEDDDDDGKNKKLWRKTSLQKYIFIFDSFVLNLMKSLKEQSMEI